MRENAFVEMVWSTERANAWYAAQGAWKQGVNFVPSTAVNQIQMWQEYDVMTMERELQWAADLNYNALRVFLHDQMYTFEGQAFLDKVDSFLTVASDLGFSTVLVLLEGIWDPYPQYTPGIPQPTAIPMVHNSRWLQSPGADALANDTMLETSVQPYVEALIQRFGNDTARVLMFDLMDQPENPNLLSYGSVGERTLFTQDALGTELEASTKMDLIQSFIPKLLDWVQAADPYRQVPVTIADWSVEDLPGPLGVTQDILRQMYLSNSDIITFHHYGPDVLQKLNGLQEQFPGRPVVLSSFMARDDDSRLDPILGDMYQRNVWAMHWGWVSGATQTIFNSDSWNIEYVSPPKIWHHDMLWPNGTAFNETERAYLLSFRQEIDSGSLGKNTSVLPPPPTLPPGTGITSSPTQPTTIPPILDTESWIGPKWAETCVTLVGIFGLVALVATCVWYGIRRMGRIRAHTIENSFDVVAHAEEHDLNELL